ncbi:MAG: hypothetical protein AAF206_00355 [Bacteroidota bacterium]
MRFYFFVLLLFWLACGKARVQTPSTDCQDRIHFMSIEGLHADSIGIVYSQDPDQDFELSETEEALDESLAFIRSGRARFRYVHSIMLSTRHSLRTGYQGAPVEGGYYHCRSAFEGYQPQLILQNEELADFGAATNALRKIGVGEIEDQIKIKPSRLKDDQVVLMYSMIEEEALCSEAGDCVDWDTYFDSFETTYDLPVNADSFAVELKRRYWEKINRIMGLSAQQKAAIQAAIRERVKIEVVAPTKIYLRYPRRLQLKELRFRLRRWNEQSGGWERVFDHHWARGHLRLGRIMDQAKVEAELLLQLSATS